MPTTLIRRQKLALLHAALIFVAVFLTYSNVLHAPFAVWDDVERVVNNLDIHSLNWAGISSWFSKFYVGVYEPLVMFLYSIGYAIGKGDAHVFHLMGITIHWVNCLLLYSLLVTVLKHPAMALTTSILFAVHPVNTESVAWIAEQHTLLSGFFILLAMKIYASYPDDQKRWRLWAVFLVGLCAMLSKGIAVTLPLLLLAVNLMMTGRKLTRPVLVLLATLSLASVAIGLVAIKGQVSANWSVTHGEYSVLDKLVLACYIYCAYAVHLLLPTKLSLMYPYPTLVSMSYYWFLLVPIVVASFIRLAWKRKWYVALGGILWYSASIAIVLQLVPYGVYLMADRFLYVAGIGILIPTTFYFIRWAEKAKRKWMLVGSLTICVALLALHSYGRNKAWGSESDFFKTIVLENPNSATARYSLGAVLMSRGRLEEAKPYIEQAILLEPTNYIAWYNKGALCLQQGRIVDAIDALNKCLSFKNFPEAYFSRAMIYMGIGNSEQAWWDIQNVLAVQPENGKAWYIDGYCIEQHGDAKAAAEAYTRAIVYEPGEPLFYLHRGIANLKCKLTTAAIKDLNKAIELNESSAEAYYYRGIAKSKAGQDGSVDIRIAAAKGYRSREDSLHYR